MNSKPIAMARLDTKPRFPLSWTKFVDDVLTTSVKKHYSPKEQWKDKPFSETDVKFYVRAIEELSDILTEYRDEGVQAGRYLQNPKYRSSYLLYYVPLQGAKFLALMDQHRQAMADLLSAPKDRPLRILDIGAGPGTASLALLCWLQENSVARPVELNWIEGNRKISEDGRVLVDAWREEFAPWKDQVKLNIQVGNWMQSDFENEEWDLVIFGHVLNEADLTSQNVRKIAKLTENFSGAGVLILEPASRQTSRQITKIRDEICEHIDGTTFYGPCLHSGRCPLGEGRDWCHFSIPADLPGKWLESFNKHLSGRKEWLKFSYLWFAGKGAEHLSKELKRAEKEEWFRVLSDPIATGPRKKTLLCAPEAVKTMPSPNRPLWRGALIQVSLKTNGNTLLQQKVRQNRGRKSPR
jgi:hypothetical protein